MMKQVLCVAFMTAALTDSTFAADESRTLPEIPTMIRNSVRLDWRRPEIKEETRTVLVKWMLANLSDADCHHVLRIKRISAIDVRKVGSITDLQIQILTQIPDLRWILTNGKNLTDQCTVVLAKSSALEMVDLSESKVSDEGVARLVTLKNLQVLNLRSTQFCGSDLSKLRDFPALETLRCENTPVDSRICEEVVRIKTLKQLHLDNTKVSDEGIGLLRRSQSLEELYLGRLPQLTFAGFREVILLPKLRILNLDDCRVEDAWLDAIPARSSIRQLYLTGNAPYTLPAIVRLQRRNPQMSVFHGRAVKPRARPGEVTKRNGFDGTLLSQVLLAR